jgi:hypothetical protein
MALLVNMAILNVSYVCERNTNFCGYSEEVYLK